MNTKGYLQIKEWNTKAVEIKYLEGQAKICRPNIWQT